MAADLDSPASFEAPEYSTTNIQVQGVDEGDIVKNDGRFIYQINHGRVLVIEAYPEESLQVRSILDFDSYFCPREVYLREDRLIVVGTSQGVVGGSEARTEADMPPEDYGMVPLYLDSAADDDFRFVDTASVEYFPDRTIRYLIVGGLDVDDPETPARPRAYLGESGQVYASQRSLYVASASYARNEDDRRRYTRIRKFALEEGTSAYLSCGAVPGRILNQFSMDEHGDHFRIATTTGNVWSSESNAENHVYVLNEGLDVVGAVEGLAPGERIYGGFVILGPLTRGFAGLRPAHL